MNKFIGIIPARYASSRFPGKPLADIGGITMIERVYRQVKKELDQVFVATDDDRIFDTVQSFGGKAIMTSTEHRSGTDRVNEAYHEIDTDANIIINIQGDEPFVAPEQIATIKKCFDDPDTQIATLARKYDAANGFEGLFDPNKVKVIFDNNDFAIYFSRAILPYVRNYKWNEWLQHRDFYIHVGMYAYRSDVLDNVTKLPQSSLELAESLEQLRWLQNGYKIKVALTDAPTFGIDTPEDLEQAKKLFNIQ
ncbi:MAG: 3-deoxy-manno-octulosonate cytidylyltransferase [Bacteroidales bacterium]|nr:3-deoxy-manno-octulosonate cytidylyltransferase [Bacteroidales bacterium]